tara:strand:+ start:120 stop:356 length:237 start_codon:yes stop_codon:yes gene_type:complete
MATVKEEIAVMKERMGSVEKTLKKMDGKIDNLTDTLLNPDRGVTSRVNKNTSARKNISKALWTLYGIVAAAFAKMFLG